MLKNSKGNVYYGMHFYPGVAEYRGADGKPYRIFLNENTLRSMDPSFAGRPIFVEHVDEVDVDVDDVREEADGWVLESFFNKADGKHWTKFILVSKKAEDARRAGYKLSNAYVPKQFGPGGLWNGVEYEKEVLAGEFEHLALVRNPRYEESMILTPDEFKKYNTEKEIELAKLANSNDNKGEKDMGKAVLAFFRRKTEKVENSAELEGLHVTLPKSKIEVSIEKLVNDADEMASMKKEDLMANGEHHVLVGEKKMSVNELIEAHKKLNEELEALRGKEHIEDDAEDEEAKKKALELAEHEEREIEEEKKENEESEEEKKKKAEEEKKHNEAEKKKNFEKLANARKNKESEGRAVFIDLPQDRVERGKARYGSN